MTWHGIMDELLNLVANSLSNNTGSSSGQSLDINSILNLATKIIGPTITASGSSTPGSCNCVFRLDPLSPAEARENEIFERKMTKLQTKVDDLHNDLLELENEKVALEANHNVIRAQLAAEKTKYANQCEGYLKMHGITFSCLVEDEVIKKAQREHLRGLLNEWFTPQTKDLSEFEQRVANTSFATLYTRAASYDPERFTIYSKTL